MLLRRARHLRLDCETWVGGVLRLTTTVLLLQEAARSRSRTNIASLLETLGERRRYPAGHFLVRRGCASRRSSSFWVARHRFRATTLALQYRFRRSVLARSSETCPSWPAHPPARPLLLFRLLRFKRSTTPRFGRRWPRTHASPRIFTACWRASSPRAFAMSLRRLSRWLRRPPTPARSGEPVISPSDGRHVQVGICVMRCGRLGRRPRTRGTRRLRARGAPP